MLKILSKSNFSKLIEQKIGYLCLFSYLLIFFRFLGQNFLYFGHKGLETKNVKSIVFAKYLHIAIYVQNFREIFMNFYE